MIVAVVAVRVTVMQRVDMAFVDHGDMAAARAVRVVTMLVMGQVAAAHGCAILSSQEWAGAGACAWLGRDARGLMTMRHGIPSVHGIMDYVRADIDARLPVVLLAVAQTGSAPMASQAWLGRRDNARHVCRVLRWATDAACGS